MDKLLEVMSGKGDEITSGTCYGCWLYVDHVLIIPPRAEGVTISPLELEGMRWHLGSCLN